MNLNILEKAARQLKNSKNVVAPVEHKNLSSLSMQIAANMRANGTAAAPAIPSQVYAIWI